MNRTTAMVCATVLTLGALVFAGYLLTHGVSDAVVTAMLVVGVSPLVTAFIALVRANDAQKTAAASAADMARAARIHNSLHAELNTTVKDAAAAIVESTTSNGH